ncbi:MAG: GHKL domain-containing protein [Phycisphaerae bacterium]|nr:GHKL domain-containing protein [Phycisphaerae bacterium]
MAREVEQQGDSRVRNFDLSKQHLRCSGFSGLAESILSSLSVGVVAYDLDLKVRGANAEAGKVIVLCESIDSSLAAGTDERVWGNWRMFLQAAIVDGKRGEFERVKYQSPGQQRLLHIVCMPVRDNDSGPIVGGMVVIQDVTEKADTEHQLAQAERLAAIGKVAGRVAHELNNPMDGILRYINLASRIIDQGDADKAKEYLGHSRNGLLRMVQILGELLEFSRSTYSAFDYATVDKIAADAVRALESRSEGVEIKIVHECPHAIGPVRVMSLFQVFCNLIKNAIDAMQGRGTLTIRIWCADEVLFVSFGDTGRGFAADDAARIFEPFYTTKGPGKGTGLGLSICKDIIEKYGGRITAENAAGGGGVFTVQLPLTEAVLKRQEQGRQQ